MNYHLINQRNPTHTLTLTRGAWYTLLDLAHQSGWQPMGTVRQGALQGLATGRLDDLPLADGGGGTYLPATRRLVMLEDALNLMDALERAFLAYEPQWLPTYSHFFHTERDALRDQASPGIGSLLALAEFCRAGSFTIEGRRSLSK